MMSKGYDEITAHEAWMQTFKHSGQSMIEPMKISDRLKKSGTNITTPPATLQMRPLMYSLLVRQAEYLGVEIQYSMKVVSFGEDEVEGKAYCETEGGDEFEADVIIVADGIGSRSQNITGGQKRANRSGRAIWRAAFPATHLEKNKDVKEFFKLMPGGEPILRAWLAPGGYALTLTRPDTIVWVMNHDVSARKVLNSMDNAN
jgi:flavin-dependent dehydrogenase